MCVIGHPFRFPPEDVRCALDQQLLAVAEDFVHEIETRVAQAYDIYLTAYCSRDIGDQRELVGNYGPRWQQYREVDIAPGPLVAARKTSIRVNGPCFWQSCGKRIARLFENAAAVWGMHERDTTPHSARNATKSPYLRVIGLL